MRFDILSSQINVAGQMEFVASAAVLEVALLPPAVGAGLEFRDTNLSAQFDPGDNIKLQRLWITRPFGFGPGNGTTTLGLKFVDSLGATIIIPELPPGGVIPFPDMCDSIEFPGDGLFLRAPINAGKFRLMLTDDTAMNFSMLNLPLGLDGQTIKVQVHAQLSHTLNLS
jgi:hypothetical protein